MAARKRQTTRVCQLIEFTEDAAVRAHRVILVAFQNDGRICDQEIGDVLAAVGDVIDSAGTSVTAAADADHSIAAGLSLIHNGNSPRSQRLFGELNVIEVDFRREDPDGTDDDGVAIAA